MTLNHVELEVEGPIGWYRFDRPPLNAVDWAMLTELEAGVRELLANPAVRIIVLASANERYFSTGADIASFQGQLERLPEWIQATQALARTLRGAAKPILAAINGVAVGGGLEMALHADLRFAASDARLGLPEVNIAFIPPVGGTQGLIRLVGRSKAFEILYGGELMSAHEAHACGLVDVVSSPDALLDDVRAYAEKLAAKPANTLAAIRRCLIDGGAADIDAGLDIERREALALCRHPNFAEGVDAFLSKREPRWS